MLVCLLAVISFRSSTGLISLLPGPVVVSTTKLRQVFVFPGHHDDSLKRPLASFIDPRIQRCRARHPKPLCLYIWGLLDPMYTRYSGLFQEKQRKKRWIRIFRKVLRGWTESAPPFVPESGSELPAGRKRRSKQGENHDKNNQPEREDEPTAVGANQSELIAALLPRKHPARILLEIERHDLAGCLGLGSRLEGFLTLRTNR